MTDTLKVKLLRLTEKRKELKRQHPMLCELTNTASYYVTTYTTERYKNGEKYNAMSSNLKICVIIIITAGPSGRAV
jgi:hypothetical protein